MDSRTKWRHSSYHCDTCNRPVSNTNRSRHLQTQEHRLLAERIARRAETSASLTMAAGQDARQDRVQRLVENRRAVRELAIDLHQMIGCGLPRNLHHHLARRAAPQLPRVVRDACIQATRVLTRHFRQRVERFGLVYNTCMPDGRRPLASTPRAATPDVSHGATIRNEEEEFGPTPEITEIDAEEYAEPPTHGIVTAGSPRPGTSGEPGPAQPQTTDVNIPPLHPSPKKGPASQAKNWEREMTSTPSKGSADESQEESVLSGTSLRRGTHGRRLSESSDTDVEGEVKEPAKKKRGEEHRVSLKYERKKSSGTGYRGPEVPVLKPFTEAPTTAAATFLDELLLSQQVPTPGYIIPRKDKVNTSTTSAKPASVIAPPATEVVYGPWNRLPRREVETVPGIPTHSRQRYATSRINRPESVRAEFAQQEEDPRRHLLMEHFSRRQRSPPTRRTPDGRRHGTTGHYHRSPSHHGRTSFTPSYRAHRHDRERDRRTQQEHDAFREECQRAFEKAWDTFRTRRDK